MKLKNLRNLFLLGAFLIVSLATNAQVTTSGINGIISDSETSEPLIGATVVATHNSSGTQYAVMTDEKGNYRIPNTRTGGPYTVAITLMGYRDYEATNIVLRLGENFVVNADLKEESMELDEVVFTAEATNSPLSSDRSGTSTVFTNEVLDVMPTISRTMSDFTRMTPQASGGSFAGQNSDYNTIKVDGAQMQNNFGIGGLPGGGISLDAIEEISVNIAPFDVRISNFTGASINAVTRSGDNTLQGSAYTYIRPKSFTGNKVGEEVLENVNDNSVNTYGARLAGALVPNKLFFFVNGEFEKETYPGMQWSASENGVADVSKNISRVKYSDLKEMSEFLQNKYNYNPGNYGTPKPFGSSTYKFLARLDWNINTAHKLTLRYNEAGSKNDSQASGSSPGWPYLQGSVNGVWGKYNEVGMTYHDSGYNSNNTLRSAVAELNSIFGSNMANKLLVSYTRLHNKRGSDSEMFPFVDICKPLTESDGIGIVDEPGSTNALNRHYMSFGYEHYTYGNEVLTNTLSISDNFNWYLNDHTFTVGLSYDYMDFANTFMQYGTSYYRYNSLEDFYNNAAPAMFAVTYAHDGNEYAPSLLDFATFSGYIQDEYQVNRRLKLQAGIRFDKVFFMNKLTKNPAIADRTFYDLDNNVEHLDVSQWPKGQLTISPRFGFNYDILGNRSLVVRGGTGIFSGAVPFVWLTNMPNNSGTLQSTKIITDPKVLEGLKFNPNFREQLESNRELFPLNQTLVPSVTSAIDDEFEMPREWRSNVALDVKLPSNWMLTLEGIYSKTVRGLAQRNANQMKPSLTMEGEDNRPVFTNSEKIVNTDMGEGAYVLYNLNKGNYSSLTAQISKLFSNGFYANLAYTYTVSKEATPMSGTRPNEPWKNSFTYTTLNESGISFSDNATPHRVVGSLSYKKEYLRNFATSISIFYEGSSQGRFSYSYANDINNDGQVADLLYVPATKDELNFVDATDSKGNVTMTATEQREAFWNFVEGNKYLNKHKGEYTERNGGVMSWINNFDLRIAQDFYSKFGTDTKHNLQVSIDFTNVGNFINPNWGVRQTTTSAKSPLKRTDKNYSEKPEYILNASSIDNFSTELFRDYLNTNSTWGCQLGIRYTF